jgi:hypothetical protein
MIKLTLMLVGGVILAVVGLLTTAHKPFQEWLYLREKGGSADLKSKEFEQARSVYQISGAGAGVAGFVLAMIALSEMGLID